MPMTYKINLEQELVVFYASGRLTNEEMVSCIAALNKDPQLIEGMRSFTDARSVKIMDVTAEGFKALAGVMDDSEKPRGSSQAALLVSNEGNAMLARLLVAFSDNRSTMPRYKMFTDLKEAESWLGASLEKIESG